MIWSEMRAALSAHGLLRGDRPDSAVRLEAAVTGIAYDSRRVAPGNVFVGLQGLHADGATFARQALDRGAVAVVADRAAPTGFDDRWVEVADGRLALALLAAVFFRHPSREMQVVGITGTNGKTTTAYLIAAILDAAGLRAGILGTVGYRIGDEVRTATHTTPEAPEVQALLREMVDRGCGACAMEVSSHALALRRVDGVEFAAAVFTNLTRDHLDFHADMEAYYQAKRRLFELLPAGATAIINADDPRAAALAEVCSRRMTYGVTRPADITSGPLTIALDGLRFEVRTPRGTLAVRSTLVGRPNVSNILAAVATASALGLPLDAIERGIATLPGVPGRFEVVSAPDDGVTVVVDYAHTDDALRKLLETARQLTDGRLITVFGCGGDRDRTKRPLMGAVAGRLSDLILITSDNPRGEEPTRIIEEIRRGITPDTRRDRTQRVLAIVDRREAIGRAIELARAGDLVLIAGKGHEKFQAIGSAVIAFDDVAVARDALTQRRSNSGVV
jgi:UDP-N-acetylmuramoyl-L-alanyl-D-glutamate--2,6-diaminopimelate ligase